MPSQGGKVDMAKRNVKVSKCPRQNRCSALEPVLEHCELADTIYAPCKSYGPQQCPNSRSQKGKPLRILLKLRDGYVKLMNDMALGADLAGVSSFYGNAGIGDYPTSTAHPKISVTTEQEKALLHALQSQPYASQRASAVA